jgi:predicted ATPase
MRYKGGNFMKYNDLISFEPIEGVIQLCDASEQDYAYQLIDTYVISNRMAEIIKDIIIEQLQYSRPVDNKGVFIVGNYGTGKSHLMSVIATLAEFDNSTDRANNEEVKKAAKEIEGKFKVIRIEIGATTKPLRDLICEEIEDYLESIGIEYSFPGMTDITNNKDLFHEMMAEFNNKYPDKGLLLVCDELLDYLRARKQQEIILDLGFLRELGEICKSTKFRFIAGIQEMLFDNPSFQFVANLLQRVRERFEVISIVREDIAYVVSQRLLKKNDKQKDLIREHLQKFTPYFNGLTERMDEFVELFPVHPDYLAIFEKVYVAEKRVILKTLSHEMKQLMDNDVPVDSSGVVSFDSYWTHIENDPSLKASPTIREVRNKSDILQDKIKSAFTKKIYQPMALRIVKALSIHRLTTGDIYTKLGLTSEELRDQLFLFINIPEKDSVFLQRTIESVLKEILKTVSYQYISFNEDNGQYYIDIKKDIAVDELIEQRAETLDNSALDIYYFNAFEKVVDCSETTYVTGYKIWYYEIPWYERRVTREGYLFFGAPNERSTAQPPRDFYIYILQPYEPPHFKDEHKQDEIFIRLKKKDEKFDRFLKLYAGAKEMSNIAPSGTKNLYEAKAAEYFKSLSDWIRNNFTNVYEVTYKGEKSPVLTAAKNIPPYAGIREIINAIASTCFSGYLHDKYPDYPHFSKLLTPLTHANMKDYIFEAYQYFNGKTTTMGMAILNGFVLLHDDKIKVHKSGYAKWIIDQLENLKPGQVINRSELIDTIYTKIGTKDVELTKKFKIEPELFSVILIALVYNGDMVITIAGTPYEAMNLEQLIKLTIEDIVNFSHIKKPSGLPMPALSALFDFLEIQPLYLKQDYLGVGVKQLCENSVKYSEKIARIEHEINEGIKYWNGEFLTKYEKEKYKSEISALKAFMESLQKFNTPAKLQNFKYSVEEVNDYKEKLKKIDQIIILKEKIKEINEIALYLKHVQTNMADDTELVAQVDEALKDVIDDIKKNNDIANSMNTLKKLKSKYIDLYLGMHNQARLSASEDNKKQKLLYDKKINALRQLKEIDILPGNKCDELIDKITKMKPCWNLTKEKLERFPICSDCQFRPKEEKILKSFNLEEIEDELEDLLENWTDTLINTFKDPEIKVSIELLTKEQKIMISTLIKNGKFELPINIGLIEAIKELLHGIEKIEISVDELKNIMGNGNPLTLSDVKERFNSFINNKMSSMDEHNIRFVLKQETDK